MSKYNVYFNQIHLPFNNLLQKFPIFLIFTFLAYLLSIQHPILFHTGIESFSLVVALLTYILARNTYHISENNFLLYIGISYLYISILDCLHTLTFHGMNFFNSSLSLSFQLWITARFLESISLFIAPFLITKKINFKLIHSFYGTVCTIIILSTIWLEVFPVYLTESNVPTTFKILSEYVICFFFICSLINLYYHKDRLNQVIYPIFLTSIAFSLLSIISFTLYTSNQDLMIFLGHLLKLISYILIYNGILTHGLKEPFNLIFAKLVKTNKELEELNENKSRFLGIAAHDLRNPLGGILMCSKFLLDNHHQDPLSPRQEKFLRQIFTSSEYMLKLVEELLDLSTIETGNLNLEIRPTNLIPLLKNNISLNESIANSKNIQLIFTCDEYPLIAHIDPVKIEQVMNNLITNAIKYSYPNSIVEINVFKAHNNVLIEVRDYGQGIPSNEIELIFTPFKCSSVKATAGEKSTGLGLTITRKIVEGHHGRIWVESKVGVGSKFFVSLPLTSSAISA